MFKSILPGKRSPLDTEFTMVTSPTDSAVNGKENQSLAYGAAKSKQHDKHRAKRSVDVNPVFTETNMAFESLLDDLQIPDSIRPKLMGMESTVKAAMIKSSHNLVLPQAPLEPPSTPPAVRSLRRVQSGSSINIESPRQQHSASTFYQQPSMVISGITLADSGRHARGSSMDLVGMKSRSAAPESNSKTAKDKGPSRNLSPVQFVSQLTGTSSQVLPVELVKKLCLMLRNEPASWTQDFLKCGGYSALLTRLNELLEVEWREEQHDDHLLHELLRCLKALSTSSIGCFALRSSCPTPFVQLVSLLYSDKKPGDVATRQLIVDLLLILFDLYPSNSLSGAGFRRTVPDAVTLPYPHTSLFGLLRALLLTPAPRAAEAPETTVSPHDFIEGLHRPRLYKTYLQELSDICRDYFWIFCHPNNTIWILNETDEGKVEKPKAPGGMTGGVEFEAMGYLTAHFRLVNAFAKAAQDNGLPKEHELSAYKLHEDLFLSGLERVLLVARKASTTYYPTLHLEIARYVALAGQARYELPWTVSRLMGHPPSTLTRRSGHSTALPTPPTRSAHNSPRGSPTKKSGPAPPALPSPRRLEPLRLE